MLHYVTVYTVMQRRTKSESIKVIRSFGKRVPRLKIGGK